MKKIVLNRKLNNDETLKVQEIANAVSLSFETSSILYLRGIDTVKKAKKYLNAGKHNFYDPYLLGGMEDAVKRIKQAKENGERVLIYGDYDADGISATAVLYYALKEFGITAFVTVPEREDGYGLNEERVEYFATEEFVDLIITVDCGISDKDKVDFIKNDLGIDVIVTDHHEVPLELPDCTAINPKIKGQEYPFDALCGAGVAFKLATALIGEEANKYLDFVALATVADSMSLTDENRDIVVEGLSLIKHKKAHKCFYQLLAGNAYAMKDLSARTLAFNVAPKINAAGRMGDAASALRLFLSDDDNEIFDLTVKLNVYNSERQDECETLYKQAKQQLEQKGAYKNVIMLYNESWKTGFVGIVAARLVEEFNRPVILFAGHSGELKGSARSIDGVNIFEAINENKELLIEFGGHSQAAGVAIAKENFERFEDAIDKFLSKRYSKDVFIPTVNAEMIIDKKFSLNFAKELLCIEPCGIDNRKPLFVTEVNDTTVNILKQGTKHINFESEYLSLIYFNGDRYSEILSAPIKKQIVFEPNVSVYNGRETLKGYVKECLPIFESNETAKLFAFNKQIEGLKKREDGEVTILSFNKMQEIIGEELTCGYGTVFLANDLKTLQKYDMIKDVEVNLFAPYNKNMFNLIVFAPASDIDLSGYKTIIYLDKPLNRLVLSKGQTAYECEDLDGLERFKSLKTERKVFAIAFEELKAFNNTAFTNSAQLALRYKGELSKEQFIFCLETFLELGFFKREKGFLRLDRSVKGDLNNSVIYTKILSINS